RPEKALEPLARSLSITGRSADAAQAMYLLGDAFQRMDRLEEAVTVLEESLTLDPLHSNARDAHRLLSDLYVNRGETDKAIAHRAQYLFFLGAGLQELGERVQAVRALRDSLALDPSHPYAAAARRLLAAGGIPDGGAPAGDQGQLRPPATY
ncbi:MAG: tetratricopeptide repeat protein, partial [Dehalococcoidia bacterium]